MLSPYLLALATCSVPNPIPVHVDVATPDLEDRLPAFARSVRTTLADPRGWQRSGLTFCPATRAEATVVVVLADPGATSELCHPIATYGRVSCAMWDTAVVNLAPWLAPPGAWGFDVEGYQTYVVNHEVGHVLGFDHANHCTASDQAPLMMQQSRRRPPCFVAGARPTWWEAEVLGRKLDSGRLDPMLATVLNSQRRSEPPVSRDGE